MSSHSDRVQVFISIEDTELFSGFLTWLMNSERRPQGLNSTMTRIHGRQCEYCIFILVKAMKPVFTTSRSLTAAHPQERRKKRTGQDNDLLSQAIKCLVLVHGSKWK